MGVKICKSFCGELGIDISLLGWIFKHSCIVVNKLCTNVILLATKGETCSTVAQYYCASFIYGAVQPIPLGCDILEK